MDPPVFSTAKTGRGQRNTKDCVVFPGRTGDVAWTYRPCIGPLQKKMVERANKKLKLSCPKL
ncbi:MAG: hypothetical protein LBW77_03195, partial [Verrucomicrobiota bacterium]|nr:hypothetical protein [Verrucomicrobiota bacterium]